MYPVDGDVDNKHFPPMEPDYGYWEKNGWQKSGRPWKK